MKPPAAVILSSSSLTFGLCSAEMRMPFPSRLESNQLPVDFDYHKTACASPTFATTSVLSPDGALLGAKCTVNSNHTE